MTFTIARDVSVATKERPNHIVRHYRVSDYAQALRERINSTLDFAGRQSLEGSQYFTATKDASEYADMLANGWPAGMPKAKSGLDGLATDAAQALELIRSVAGAFPMVPTMLAGQPDHMLLPVRQSADRVRSISLVINAAFQAGVRSEDVLAYAHSVMRFVAWLEAEQVEASVFLSSTNRFDKKTVTYITPIREAGSFMQAERIAAMVHPSWHRRAWFALLECEAKALGKTSPECQATHGGYGYPRETPLEVLQVALPYSESVAVLPAPGGCNPDEAIEHAVNLKLRVSE